MEPPADDAAPEASRASRVRRVAVVWLPPLLLVLVALVMVALHVRLYTKVSPIDELQHIDYLYRAPDLVLPGDRVGDDAMRQQACRGIDYPVEGLPPCSPTEDYDPEEFQERGFNTAAINTPFYYTVTRAAAAVIQAVTPADDLVTAGRLVGGLWLGAGLVVAYLAGRRLGAPRWPLTAVLTITAVTPAVVYPSATITPDAGTLLSGAAVLWTLLWWEERPQRRWPWLAAVAVAVVALKMTNALVLVAVGAYLVLRYARARWRPEETMPPEHPPRAWLVGALAVAVTTAVVAGAWTVGQSLVTPESVEQIPMNVRFHVEALQEMPLVGNLGTWLMPAWGVWAPVGNGQAEAALVRLGNLALVSGLVAITFFGARAARERVLAAATALVGFLGAPVFIVLVYLLQSAYFPPPPRYAATLLPIMAALTALCVRGRWPRLVLGGLAVLAVLVSLLRLGLA